MGICIRCYPYYPHSNVTRFIPYYSLTINDTTINDYNITLLLNTNKKRDLDYTVETYEVSKKNILLVFKHCNSYKMFSKHEVQSTEFWNSLIRKTFPWLNSMVCYQLYSFRYIGYSNWTLCNLINSNVLDKVNFGKPKYYE